MYSLIKKVVVLLVCCLSVAVVAQAQVADIASVDIQAVKSLKLVETESTYDCDAVILIQNASEQDVKFQDIRFMVSFAAGDKTVPFGTAPVSSLILPKDEISEVKLTIKVGPKDEKTTKRLIELFNMTGNPAMAPIMLLNGTGEVGVNIGAASHQDAAVTSENVIEAHIG